MEIKQNTPMVITDKLDQLRAFYTEKLGCTVAYDGKGYLGLKAAGLDGVEIAFVQPCDGQPCFAGQGLSYALEVPDVDAQFDRLKGQGVPVISPVQDHPWGGRAFIIADPVGVGLCIFSPIPMTAEYKAHAKG